MLGCAAKGAAVIALVGVCTLSCALISGAADLDVVDLPVVPAPDREDRVDAPDDVVAPSVDHDSGADTWSPVDSSSPADAKPDTAVPPPPTKPDAAIVCVPATTPERFGTSTAGTVGDWEAPSRVFVKDDLSTTWDDQRGVLRVSGFGFALPATATVKGIQVTVRRKSAGAALFEQLAVGAASKSDLVALPNDFVEQPYGGSTDTWGRSWTVAQVNAASFGVGVTYAADEAQARVEVDSVSITVSYCAFP